MSLAELRQRADTLQIGPRGQPPPRRRGRGAAVPRRRFSVFDNAQLDLAAQLSEELGAFVDGLDAGNAAALEAGLGAALDRAETAMAEFDPALVRWALMLFITHHPVGHQLSIPSFEERRFDDLRPSVRRGLAAGVGPEAPLNWYREDPWGSAHHEHWHVVYPSRGVTFDGHQVHKARHGELFVYMHRQMLARYETERLCANAPRLAALSNYRSIIPEAYAASPGVAESRRPPGQRMHDVIVPEDHRYDIRIADLEQWRDALLAAATSGKFAGVPVAKRAVTADVFGATIEPSPASVLPSRYGALHNLGHGALAALSDDGNGVMSDPATALRDPVFYRWHKQIDDLAFAWEETQARQVFTDIPAVRVRNGTAGPTSPRSPDLFLCPSRIVPTGAAAQGWADTNFGGAKWDTFEFPQLATDELRTWMASYTIAGGQGTQAVKSLASDPFTYVIRMENTAAQATRVTLRLFLAATDLVDDRRMWIELDKFDQTLPPGKRVVIVRRDTDSSVVRKPTTATPQTPRHAGGTAEASYCQCGWPYHLLIPSGRPSPTPGKGMPFRLMLCVSDWNLDRVPDAGTCGSMSFCGLRDSTYPDQRDMGYPFARPFPAGRSIAQTMEDLGSMACRDITIRRLAQPPAP